jgi:hypothetical protein
MPQLFELIIRARFSDDDNLIVVGRAELINLLERAGIPHSLSIPDTPSV